MRKGDVNGRVERDSTKDQTVVFVFIIATVSLLAWALAKPFVGGWMHVGIVVRC